VAERILIIDDEERIRKLLIMYLEKEGYIVDEASNGHDGLERLKYMDYSCVLLDVQLPMLNGKSILSELRKTKATPVIIMSGQADEQSRVEGFELGADDYVTKPFNPLEVIARVKSLLRRTSALTKESESAEEITIGPLLINKGSHQVTTLDGLEIQLTVLEFGILFLLASHPNKVFSADEIFETVWQQESIVSTKTVMVHVSHLRDKIAEATGGDKVIETVWGVGYKIESK